MPMNGAEIDDETRDRIRRAMDGEQPGEQKKAEDLPALPESPAPKVDANAAIDAQLLPIVGVMIRGIMSGAPGVPVPLILNAIARTCGKTLALSVVGNTIELTSKARADFQESFKAGIGQVSILAQGPAPRQPMPPMPPR
jgi:hypothetical protein